jgi:hypothetical protein
LDRRLGGGARAVLDTVVKRKIPIPRLESNPRTPIVQPVAQRYTDGAVTALVMKVPAYMKLGGSLQCSQKPAKRSPHTIVVVVVVVVVVIIIIEIWYRDRLRAERSDFRGSIPCGG